VTDNPHNQTNEKGIGSSSPKQAISASMTPRIAIWEKNKAILWYYPASVKKYKTPLFLIYSLVNRAYILDLGPGYSMVEGFVEQGYDVYLLDFGIPSYEDKDINLGNYIFDYIQTAARRTLRHSGAKELTVIGYCLGGTLAVIYAAVATEPIKNLIVFAAPLDFSEVPYMHKWHEALKRGELNVDELIDEYGIVPAKVMEKVLRFLTVPINFTPYLALFGRRNDERYIERWRRFDQWVKDPVPFTGAAMKDFLHDLVINNKLIKSKLEIKGQRVKLKKITANLLVVSTEGDQLIPEKMSQSLISNVKSKDKTYKRVKGGHVTIVIKGGIPDFLAEWLAKRS
jgi:polyhydroxyalkanoate synthase subunit PhaC